MNKCFLCTTWAVMWFNNWELDFKDVETIAPIHRLIVFGYFRVEGKGLAEVADGDGPFVFTVEGSITSISPESGGIGGKNQADLTWKENKSCMNEWMNEWMTVWPCSNRDVNAQGMTSFAYNEIYSLSVESPFIVCFSLYAKSFPLDHIPVLESMYICLRAA